MTRQQQLKENSFRYTAERYCARLPFLLWDITWLDLTSIFKSWPLLRNLTKKRLGSIDIVSFDCHQLTTLVPK